MCMYNTCKLCIDDLLLRFFRQTTQATSVTKTTIRIIITTTISTAMYTAI